MVFNKSGRKINKDLFKFNDVNIEQCMEYKYLGIIFKPSGSFTEAMKHLCRKASKAMFCIRKLLRSDSLNIYPHLKLFDACVRPILLYGSEIWLLNTIKENKDIEPKYFSMDIVKAQIKFMKSVLGVNKSAVNLAVLSELGRYPISIYAFKASIE